MPPPQDGSERPLAKRLSGRQRQTVRAGSSPQGTGRRSRPLAALSCLRGAPCCGPDEGTGRSPAVARVRDATGRRARYNRSVANGRPVCGRHREPYLERGRICLPPAFCGIGKIPRPKPRAAPARSPHARMQQPLLKIVTFLLAAGRRLAGLPLDAAPLLRCHHSGGIVIALLSTAAATMPCSASPHGPQPGGADLRDP